MARRDLRRLIGAVVAGVIQQDQQHIGGALRQLDRDYQVPFAFTGKIVRLTIDLGDSTVTPEAIRNFAALMAAKARAVDGAASVSLSGGRRSVLGACQAAALPSPSRGRVRRPLE